MITVASPVSQSLSRKVSSLMFSECRPRLYKSRVAARLESCVHHPTTLASTVSKKPFVPYRAIAINCNNPPECYLHAATLPSMSAPGPKPAGASWPGDLPRPATNLPNMNAPSPNPPGASGAGDRPRPATYPPNMRGNQPGAHNMPSGAQFQDTYMLERSYVPMLGATINNISIDPAMQQHQQVANPQSATQHFNFSPGSYATFTAQHNSGNLHNSGNGAPHQSTYQPPIEDDLETGEEAYYTTMGDFGNFFDTPGGEGDSSSRVFAEKSAMGVNGSQNTFSYLGMPPQQPHEPAHDTTQPLSYQGQPSALMPGSPYPPPHYSSTRQQSSMSMVNGPLIPQSHEQQPMHYNIAHAPNVSTQHDASSYAACPRAFEHVPANGTSDRSGGNTQGNQERGSVEEP
jgi:hypothetical protein